MQSALQKSACSVQQRQQQLCQAGRCGSSSSLALAPRVQQHQQRQRQHAVPSLLQDSSSNSSSSKRGPLSRPSHVSVCVDCSSTAAFWSSSNRPHIRAGLALMRTVCAQEQWCILSCWTATHCVVLTVGRTNLSVFAPASIDT